jgi:hypothetical protein
MRPETIEELKARIKELERQEIAALQAQRDAVKVEWEYFVEPVTANSGFYRIYDDSISTYRIFGLILNKGEAEKVGHNVDTDRKGMTYLYNSLSKKIVMAIGGGQVIVSADKFSARRDLSREEVIASATRCLSRISTLIALDPHHPHRITEIVLEHHREIGRI